MFAASFRQTLRAALPAIVGGLVLLFSGAAFAEPAIWAVRDRDSTVFLFGTIHVMKPGTNWRSPRFEEAFKDADQLSSKSKILRIRQRFCRLYESTASHPTDRFPFSCPPRT